MATDIFLNIVKQSEPIDLAKESLFREFTRAIPNPEKYKEYIGTVRRDYPKSSHISIMGSGNWGFSLNPKKNLSAFHAKSDIDIVIICRESFDKTWEELRSYHRRHYYRLDDAAKTNLKRLGENVYSGFITPAWIPDKRSSFRTEYAIKTNGYSTSEIGYRSVNMMYFKNEAEAIDYYVRGFRLAKMRGVKNGV